MNKIKRVRNDVNVTLGDGGEVLSYDNVQTHILKVSKQEFAFIYRKAIVAFTGLSATDISVFIAISFGVDSNRYVFASTKGRAKELSEELSITEQSVFNSINKLHKKGFLVRNPYCKNEYYIHPDYAWKGKQEDRAKVFELILIEDLKKKEPHIQHIVKSVNE